MAPLFSRSRMHEHITVDWPSIMATRLREARDVRLKDFYSAYPIHTKTTLATAELLQAQVAHHYSASTLLAELLV